MMHEKNLDNFASRGHVSCLRNQGYPSHLTWIYNGDGLL
jgi:hypothetical protein